MKLGVMMGDLTFADEGNGDYLRDNKFWINFRKREIMQQIIVEFRLNQQVPYNLGQQGTPYFPFLLELIYSDEKELSELSYQREPKNITHSDLVQAEATFQKLEKEKKIGRKFTF